MPADVHILAIHPDLDGEDGEEELDSEETGEREAHERGVDDHLKEAYAAAHEKDEAGFIASMRAAIKACVEEWESEEDNEAPEGKEEY